MDSICYVQLSVSEALIDCVLQLAKMNPAILDQLLMVFKKGLYMSEVNGRMVSVAGLTSVLEEIMRNGQGSPFASRMNPEHLSSEILGSLRRSFK